MIAKQKRRVSLHTRRARARRVVFAALFLLALMLCGALVYGISRPEVLIHSISVSGANRLDAQSIERVVEEAMQGAYLGIIPRASTFVFPREAVRRTLLETFPPLADVSLARNGFTSLTVSVHERAPVARWCSLSEDCFVVDAVGMLFDAPGESERGLILYTSQDDLRLRSVFYDGGFSHLAERIERVSRAALRTPVQVRIDGPDARVLFAEGGEVWFETGAASPHLEENVRTVFSSRGITEREFEYVDFRFGNKVFVKFVGE